MSDEESSQSESEEETPAVVHERQPAAKSSVEENEADLVLKKRREAQLLSGSGADEFVKELLESNKKDRDRMEEEIKELRQRNEKRKKQRELEEKRLTAERAAEDERKKTAEEGKKKSKVEDDDKKQKDRSRKKSEYEKWKNPSKPNYVINKKNTSDDNIRTRKTKEELEAEKKAVLESRVCQLKIDDLDVAKLKVKAKEFQDIIYRLESEKYDMEKQFRTRQIDMVELAERYRNANKVGKGGIKRIQPTHEQPFDKIQEIFAGAPAKILMYSKYERQKDKRKYKEKQLLYTGPQFLCPAERIKPSKVVRWTEEGLPVYASDDAALTNGSVDHE